MKPLLPQAGVFVLIVKGKQYFSFAMRKAIIIILAVVSILFYNIMFNVGCNSQTSAGDKQLAQKYCGSCHMYPEPNLLPKKIWGESILPEMGVFANYYRDKQGEYHAMTSQMVASKDAAVRGFTFNIGSDEWKKIVSFYLNNAPEKLADPAKNVDTTLSLFETIIPQSINKPYTSAIYANPQAKQLYLGSIISDSLNIFNINLQYQSSINKTKGIVDIFSPDTVSENLALTHIGNFKPALPPGNRNGFVELINVKDRKVRERIADSLDRPVKTIFTDVNNDGLKDFVVCQFGFLQGELSLFVNNGKGYTKKILSPLPGAIQIYQEDINKDGWIDFWVLFAGAYEGIVQFINKGNCDFEQRTIASFPPSYGSTYFEFVDFNNDGKKDILYTCGDNADNSQVLKPYHGVYLFENTGDSYNQSFFFPINGCYKANMIDYDLDGDLDIACIAFFADYEKHPEEGFVYLENKGNNSFVPHTFPLSKIGRWICMESVDYDGDGDVDILLGNMAAKPAENRDIVLKWLKGPEFVVLKNKAK